MATQLFETDSPQVEASLGATVNPTQDFGTRIRAITYDAPAFKDADEFRAAFEDAEKGAHEAAEKKFKAEGDLVLYVAKIQSYTSERGANAHLRKAAGIPAGFERWYTDFRAKYDVEYAFKTMQHKIAQLHGGCEHCGRLAENDADHKKSCILYRPLIELAEPGKNCDRPELDMKQLTTAHYADRYMAMVGLLTNAPKDTSPEQIIATMRAEAESAYEDLDAETAKRIKVPELIAVEQPRRLHYLASKVVSLLEIREVQSALKAVTIQSGTGRSYPGKTILSTALLLEKELPAKRRTDDATQLQGADAGSSAQKEAL